MKIRFHQAWLLALAGTLGVAAASTTIDTVDRFAYGANIGWINFRWDTGSPGEGATIGQYFCSGTVYGANVGWIDLGDGSPDDGVSYSNTSAGDFGVNHDGSGNLSGFAYGANIGWIQFIAGAADPPRVDLATGQLSGFAYSANCGWIDLGSNGTHFVLSNTIDGGVDSDGDGIADAWELEQAIAAGLSPVLTHLGKGGDRDGDGDNDLDEFLADTNPFDPDDSFQILDLQFSDQLTNNITIEWNSSSRRVYDIFGSSDLNGSTALVTGLASGGDASTSMMFTDSPLGARRFWWVESRLPLAP